MPPGMPPELMQMIAGGAGTGARGTPPMPPEASQAPMTAPMSGPEPKQGDKQEALIQIQMAMDLLEHSLPAIGSETPHGKAIIGSLSSLSKLFEGSERSKTRELMPAEIMQLVSSLPQAGGASPAQKIMQGAPPMPGGGGPPGGGMPPQMPGGMPGAM